MERAHRRGGGTSGDILTALGVQNPNFGLLSNWQTGDTGGGGELMAPRVLHALDYAEVNNFPLVDLIRRQGVRISTVIDTYDPFSNWPEVSAAIKDNPLIWWDTTVLLADTLDADLTNRTIISLLGRNQPAIQMVNTTTKPILAGTATGLRMMGHWLLDYRDTAAATCRAIDMSGDYIDCEFDNFVFERCGVPLYHAGSSIDNRFSSFKAVSPLGKGIRLVNGSFLDFGVIDIRNGGDEGITIEAGWDGYLTSRKTTVLLCQKEGVTNACGNGINNLGQVLIAENSVASAGTYSGVACSAAVRDFIIESGQISGPDQLYGIDIAASSDRIKCSAKLIGNGTAAYRVLSTGDITLNGFMPSGTPKYIAGSIETFVPTAGFTTPGDQAWVYAIQDGWIMKLSSRHSYLHLQIKATPTYTTAASNLLVTVPGVTFYSAAGTLQPGLTVSDTNAGLVWGAAAATHITGATVEGTSTIRLAVDKTAAASAFITAAHLASTVEIQFRMSGIVLTAS